MHHKNRKDKELLCGGTEARNHLAGPSSRWGIKGPSRPPPGHLWPWNSPPFAPHKFGAVQSAPTRAARLTLGWHGRREPEQRCPRAGDAPPLPPSRSRLPRRAPALTRRSRAAILPSQPAAAPGQHGPCNPGLQSRRSRPTTATFPASLSPRRPAPEATDDGPPLPSQNPESHRSARRR